MRGQKSRKEGKYRPHDTEPPRSSEPLVRAAGLQTSARRSSATRLWEPFAEQSSARSAPSLLSSTPRSRRPRVRRARAATPARSRRATHTAPAARRACTVELRRVHRVQRRRGMVTAARGSYPNSRRASEIGDAMPDVARRHRYAGGRCTCERLHSRVP
jgi:hypothetical protein